MNIVSSLNEILLSVLPAFSAPTGQVFLRVVAGWVLCPTRRTITAMLPYADPKARRSHDAYHGFFRAAVWSCSTLLHLWAEVLVGALCATGVVGLLLDDTVHKKTGRKVEGAAWRRDAVRSTGQKIVYVWGLQLVLICLKVVPPWGGEPLALPINLRLYRKGGPTLLDLAVEMIQELAGWFPTRTFRLTADGFYAPLAGRDLPRTFVVSRIRHDAALYQQAPRRRRKRRGAPCKKGSRLLTPAAWAKRVRHWRKITTQERGVTKSRLVYCRIVLWYGVSSSRPILLVLSRDPQGHEKDDFFFTTDLSMTPAQVVGEFSDRWAIEDTFRNAKQFLGAEQPQCWKGEGPERAALLAYVLYGLIWLWHLRHGYRRRRLPQTPWYPRKCNPSFKDAIAALRKVIWTNRFSQTVGAGAHMNKFQRLLINALAHAA